MSLDRRAAWPRTYPASVISVTDGDTLDVFLDKGGDDYWRTDLRLNGGNAREHNKPGGPEATAHMRQLVDSVLATTIAGLFSFPAQVVSLSWDKFGGRIDGSLIVPGVGDVMQAMIRDGYAAVWDGRGPRPVPPWPIPSA
jgi:endonuclease YncB( thermonuclease family)